jgi:hypothetical protein
MNIGEIYPSKPTFAKGKIPCWLERLKVLVRLKKGTDGHGIENPQRDQGEQDGRVDGKDGELASWPRARASRRRR